MPHGGETVVMDSAPGPSPPSGTIAEGPGPEPAEEVVEKAQSECGMHQPSYLDVTDASIGHATVDEGVPGHQCWGGLGVWHSLLEARCRELSF